MSKVPEHIKEARKMRKNVIMVKYVAPIIAAATILAAGAYQYFFNSVQQDYNNARPAIVTKDRPSSQPYTFNQVASGSVTPSQYLQELFDTMPEVQKCRSSGVLKGILYDPSEKEFRELFANSYEHRSYGSLSFEEMLKRSERCFKDANNDRDAPAFTTSPTFGTEIPRYIIFKKGSLSGDFLMENDEDVRGIVSHELQHVEDLYNGITLGNIHVDYQSLRKKDVRIEFLNSFAEFRAYGKQIKSFAESLGKTGKCSESQQYIMHTCLNYLDFRNKLDKFPANTVENDLRNMQFEEFSDIAMLETDEQYLLTAMYGSKTIEIKLAKKKK